MIRGPALKADEYWQLAAEEAELAKEATSDEARAQHYAMADYYTRLAQAQEKLPGDRTEPCTSSISAKRQGAPMTKL